MFDLGAHLRATSDDDLAEYIGATIAAVVPSSVYVARDENGRVADEAIVCEIPNGRGGIQRIIECVMDGEERIEAVKRVILRVAVNREVRGRC